MAWRSLPPLGQLRLAIRSDDGGLSINEVRCASMSLLQVEWSEPEPAIALALFSLRVEPRAVKEGVRVLAVVGLHALSRRYDRGDVRTDVGMLRDLIPIVTEWPSLVKQPGNFAIPAGGGMSRGEVLPVVLSNEAMTVVSVRTFIAP